MSPQSFQCPVPQDPFCTSDSFLHATSSTLEVRPKTSTPGSPKEKGYETHKLNHAIQMLPSTFLDDPGIHVILKMMIVEGHPQAIEAQAPEKPGIGLGEEILEPLVEEVVVLLPTEHPEHGGAVLGFIARIAWILVVSVSKTKKKSLCHTTSCLFPHAPSRGWRVFLEYMMEESGRREGDWTGRRSIITLDWGDDAPVMKFSMFIQPPKPAPRKTTVFPSPSTTSLPSTFNIPGIFISSYPGRVYQ